MSRHLALLICLIAAAIGLQPWVSGMVAAATDAPEEVQAEDADAESPQTPIAQPSETRRERQSYLDRWIRRRVEARKRRRLRDVKPATQAESPTPVAEAASGEPGVAGDAPPTDVGGSLRGLPAEDASDQPASEPGALAPGDEDADANTDAAPAPKPADMPVIEEPSSPSDEGPELFELAPPQDDETPPNESVEGPLIIEIPLDEEPAGEPDGDEQADEIEAAADSPREQSQVEAGPLFDAPPEIEPAAEPTPELIAEPDVETAAPPVIEPRGPLVFEAPPASPPAEAVSPLPQPPPVFAPPELSADSVPVEMASPDPLVEQHVDAPVAFPPLPPDPYADEQPELPSLAAELNHHGGAFLYVPEGDQFQQLQQEALGHACTPEHGGVNGHAEHGHTEYGHTEHHEPAKRLPEWFQPPQPCTYGAEYLGADPIKLSPKAWPGPGGYQWEPRFVAHGRYDVFGIAFEEGGVRYDLIGHNLTLDADLRLTGTERLHYQHRPIGEDGSGGSFYQFDNPEGFVDNSTAEPARIWFEGELASVLSGWGWGGWIGDPTVAWDINFAFGKFPLQQHNNLLINDEVAGIIVGQNNLRLANESNINARVYWLFDDINSLDSFGGEANDGLTGNVVGADAFVDYQHAFIELTYAFRQHSRNSDGDAHYVAASATKFFGPATATARVLAKIAGPADRDGQLYVVEWNTHYRFEHGFLPRAGCHHAVLYANGFYATKGWDPIASANFNRIRSSFEVNPLVQVARGDVDDTPGATLGIQMFGEGDDSSLTPEIAYEAPSGISIFGAGMRYQRRTSVSSFAELRGLVNFSDHSPFERNGVFASHHWLF